MQQYPELQISNLVFQGGGVRGSAYAGAVEVLDEHGLLPGVRKIAGTSAGAITAALLAAGARPDGLKHAVLDLVTIVNSWGGWGSLRDVGRLISHFGLHHGDQFQEILAGYLKNFCGQPNLTFKELKEMALGQPGHYHELFVMASNLTLQRAEVLCAENHPDMPISMAIRISMSIPIVFAPVRIGQNLYVDGGLSWNYPIDLFDHLDPHQGQPQGMNTRINDTLGFVLTKTKYQVEDEDWTVRPQDTSSLPNYLKALGGFMYETANRQHLHHGDIFRTVFIDDLQVKSTNFNIVEKVVNRLVESGRECTSAYLAYRHALHEGKAAHRRLPHVLDYEHHLPSSPQEQPDPPQLEDSMQDK